MENGDFKITHTDCVNSDCIVRCYRNNPITMHILHPQRIIRQFQLRLMSLSVLYCIPVVLYGIIIFSNGYTAVRNRSVKSPISVIRMYPYRTR